MRAFGKSQGPSRLWSKDDRKWTKLMKSKQHVCQLQSSIKHFNYLRIRRIRRQLSHWQPEEGKLRFSYFIRRLKQTKIGFPGTINDWKFPRLAALMPNRVWLGSQNVSLIGDYDTVAFSNSNTTWAEHWMTKLLHLVEKNVLLFSNPLFCKEFWLQIEYTGKVLVVFNKVLGKVISYIAIRAFNS